MPCRVRLDIYLVGMEGKGKEEKSREAGRDRNRRGKRSSGENGARQKLPLREERQKRPLPEFLIDFINTVSRYSEYDQISHS